MRKGNLKHGHNRKGKRTRTYQVWAGMLARCRETSGHNWDYYGSKGITVCERWHDFVNFLADMDEAPDGMELDRRDFNGNYEPSNCRWVTETEQIENRCCTIYIEHGGERLSLSAWAKRIGVDRRTLYVRHLRGDKGERLLRKQKIKWDGIVEYRGERRHYREWAELLGIDQSTLYYRLRVHNFPVEEAMKPLTQNC